MSHTMAYEAGREVLLPVLTSSPKEALVAAKCLGLLAGYDERWRERHYRIDAVECVMQSDLYNPETTRKSRSFRNSGKIDVRATEIATGSKVIFDHKTSSQDITDPNAPYWRQLVIEGQVSHYMLLEWLNANKVDFGIWDVIRKPGISPRALSKKDAAQVMSGAEYCGVNFGDEELQYFEALQRETPLMYAARLAFDCTAERPEWYFQRRRVPRLDSEIQEYAQELWGHGQDILAVRLSGRHPRNSGACFTYNSPCEYLGLCSGHDSLDSGGWQTKAWVHNELPILDSGRGTDVLTNSRIRMFQTCRQKHHFKYELGIEKVDEEEKEARFFGTLFHAALEQFFLTLQKEQ